MAELKPCKCLNEYPRLVGPLIGLECGYCVRCDCVIWKKKQQYPLGIKGFDYVLDYKRG